VIISTKWLSLQALGLSLGIEIGQLIGQFAAHILRGAL
jgi:hypothetical protein